MSRPAALAAAAAVAALALTLAAAQRADGAEAGRIAGVAAANSAPPPAGDGGSGVLSDAASLARSAKRGSRDAPNPLAKTAAAAAAAGALPALTYSPSFADTFTSLNSARWWFAGPWTNGGIFSNGFVPTFWNITSSILTLPLARIPFLNPITAGSGVPGATYAFTGSEIRTQTVTYGSGCYSVCMRPMATSGLVSSFYVYSNGIWDTPFPGVSVPHREIDIEFLVSGGQVKMQSNFFNNPSAANPSRNEMLHTIPTGYNAYAFKWQPSGITWYVNGRPVRTALNSTIPTPQDTQQTMRILMNAYSVDATIGGGWAGLVPAAFRRDSSRVKWMSFKKGTGCVVDSSCSARA